MGQKQAVDFFCGAGGLSYGFSLAGITVIAGIDIDAACEETYKENNPDTKFILSDIRTLTPLELVNLGIQRNDDDMIFAGCSPCQYWTQMQTHKVNSEKTMYLLGDFQRMVEYFLPGHIVIENVRGILTNKDTSKLTEFLDFLDEHSYIKDFDVVDMAYFGVPQHRRRFLLLASRVTSDIKISNIESSCVTKVADVIGTDNGFPTIAAGHKDETVLLHTTAALSEKNLKRLKSTPHDGGTRLAWKNDAELQINAYKGKDNTYKDTYGRMHWGKPAPTITTKFMSISNGRFGHPSEDRGLSLREGATLQTFPKEYIFSGSGIGSIAKQIGNAVPPEFAKRIGKVLTNGSN